MTVTEAKVSVDPKLIYPVCMVGAVGLFFLLSHSFSLLVSTNIPILLGAIIISLLEWKQAYKQKWHPTKGQVFQDGLYMGVVQMVLPRILGFLAALFLLKQDWGWLPFLSGLWPHGWNVGFQMVLMILVADFFRYWMHRLAHNWEPLWRLHAVHHSPKELYWLNVGRFHPLEKALQYTVDALPFLLFGVHEQVLGLYFVFYAINGFFQHCNINIEMGLFNKLISGPQLHRWHHSRLIEESNSNYGNNIIIWDILFGSYFYPSNRQVEGLGLFNRAYPQSFLKQCFTPFSGKIDKYSLPLQLPTTITLNLLLKIKMWLIEKRVVTPFLKKTHNPGQHQLALLKGILQVNKDTRFGKENGFSDIFTVEEFRAKLPIATYENFREAIENQDNTDEPILTSENPFMYNQTSGTTGKPKYIPVTKSVLDDLREAQQMSAFFNFQKFPEAFTGKLLGIVSPAEEGHLPSGKPFGAASGHVYHRMPKLTRMKYALPPEVFSITEYEVKYYILARLAAAHNDITFFGAANPTTFLKIEDVLRESFQDLVKDIRMGTCKYLDRVNLSLQKGIKAKLRANPARADELVGLSDKGICLTGVWPTLHLLNTWTKGSCGVALNSVLKGQQREVQVSELGFLASELKATIVVDPARGLELPNLGQVFFEFCEKDLWESDLPEAEKRILGLEELSINTEYYLFITTKAGLYRYDMNDIIQVTGKINKCPTIEFVQKGKGTTNITGEKLYESQIIQCMKKIESEHRCQSIFYKVLANEHEAKYQLFLEMVSGNPQEIGKLLDKALCEINIEYASKRQSGRLNPLEAMRLKRGTFEAYKAHKLAAGQREGQFKFLILEYAKNNNFNWKEHSLENI